MGPTEPGRGHRSDDAAPLHRIVVVGGGLAASRTCEQLRRAGHDGELTLLTEEVHRPYDRPPLSKEVLRGERDDTTLPVDLDGLGVHVLTGTAAVGLDLGRRVVRTLTTDTVGDLPSQSGGEIRFDGLVVATGAAPVTLPGPGRQHVVRTLDDAHALRERLTPGARVVVVGSGWVGAEVAGSALARGCVVTCVESADAPAAAAVGTEVGKRLLSWWDGVELVLGAQVASVGTSAVHLADGRRLPADVVVVGVGVRPAVGWLEGSGLPLDRGLRVDEHLRAADRVVGLGDAVARWSPRYSRVLRPGHWDDAGTGAAVAAATLLDPGSDAVHDPVPYFWSDQFKHKLQYVGHHDPADPVVVREPADGRGWSAAWLDRTGALTAVLVADRPRDLLQARKALGRGCRPDPARLADPAVGFAEL